MERGQDGAIANFIPEITGYAFTTDFVLELGVATGTGSTLAIQEGLVYIADPLHISVDQRDYMEIKPQVPWWHFVIGDSRSTETLHQVELIAKGRRPGLIFIDTDHTYEQMSAELPLWATMAGEQTVWLFHDTHMFGQLNDGMVRAITEFADANGWIYEDWRPEPHGLGRMYR